MSNKKTGTLFLLPAPLQPYSPDAWEPSAIAEHVPAKALRLLQTLPVFIVESEHTAMRLLSRLRNKEQLEQLTLKILDEHSAEADVPALFEDLMAGRDCGFFSEAGMPCIADPGAALVAYARSHDVPVVAVTGPSSILLALVASGLDAQRFMFLGYLPQEKPQRRSTLQKLGRDFLYDDITRIFIETPYRNDALFEDCIAALPENALLAVATALCSPQESVACQPVAAWKSAPAPKIGKVPSVFLFGHRAGLKPRNTRASPR